MMKYENELGSIEQRINSIRMTDSRRQAAIAALRDASIVVDVCAGLLHKIAQMGAALSLKPSMGH